MPSYFIDKKFTPTNQDLKETLGSTFSIWESLVDTTKTLYPKAIEEWNFSGEKYGWSFRIKDKKRAIIYLLPQDKFFKVSLVFGQKATDAILNSAIGDDIKTELKTTKVYAEGRGIRIDVKNKSSLKDIQELIKIKLAN
jgi:hypothetical protein